MNKDTARLERRADREGRMNKDAPRLPGRRMLGEFTRTTEVPWRSTT
jgi:hypothetical protein